MQKSKKEREGASKEPSTQVKTSNIFHSSYFVLYHQFPSFTTDLSEFIFTSVYLKMFALNKLSFNTCQNSFRCSPPPQLFYKERMLLKLNAQYPRLPR